MGVEDYISLTDKQIKLIDDWTNHHICISADNNKPIWFNKTSDVDVGKTLKIKCGFCDTEYDITDIDTW
jgi:hypothetical protein